MMTDDTLCITCKHLNDLLLLSLTLCSLVYYTTIAVTDNNTNRPTNIIINTDTNCYNNDDDDNK